MPDSGSHQDSGQRGTVRIYQAIKPDGTALWPEVRPIEWLDRERLTTPKGYFDSQYMNDPSGLTGVRYNSDWIQFYTQSSMPEITTLIGVQGADPAVSESRTADYFGHCTVGRDPTDGRIYVLAFDFDRLPATRHEEYLRAQYNTWRERGLSISVVRNESHGPIQAATQHLEAVNRLSDSPLPLEIVKPKGNKEERFDELLPYIGNGTILFPGVRDATGEASILSNKGFDEFMSEFTSFPIGRRDDLMDALWLAVDSLLSATPAAALSERGNREAGANEEEEEREKARLDRRSVFGYTRIPNSSNPIALREDEMPDSTAYTVSEAEQRLRDLRSERSSFRHFSRNLPRMAHRR